MSLVLSVASSAIQILILAPSQYHCESTAEVTALYSSYGIRTIPSPQSQERYRIAVTPLEKALHASNLLRREPPYSAFYHACI